MASTLATFDQWNSGIARDRIGVAKASLCTYLWTTRDQLIWPLALCIAPGLARSNPPPPRIFNAKDLHAFYSGRIFDSSSMDKSQLQALWEAAEHRRIQKEFADKDAQQEQLAHIKTHPDYFDEAPYWSIIVQYIESTPDGSLKAFIARMRDSYEADVLQAVRTLNHGMTPKPLVSGARPPNYGMVGRLLLRSGFDWSAYSTFPKQCFEGLFAAACWEYLIIEAHRYKLLAIPEIHNIREELSTWLSSYCHLRPCGDSWQRDDYPWSDALTIGDTSSLSLYENPPTFAEWPTLLASISGAHEFQDQLQALVTTIEQSPLALLRPPHDRMFKKADKKSLIAPEVRFAIDTLISVRFSIITILPVIPANRFARA